MWRSQQLFPKMGAQTRHPDVGEQRDEQEHRACMFQWLSVMCTGQPHCLSAGQLPLDFKFSVTQLPTCLAILGTDDLGFL